MMSFPTTSKAKYKSSPLKISLKALQKISDNHSTPLRQKQKLKELTADVNSKKQTKSNKKLNPRLMNTAVLSHASTAQPPTKTAKLLVATPQKATQVLLRTTL